MVRRPSEPLISRTLSHHLRQVQIGDQVRRGATAGSVGRTPIMKSAPRPSFTHMIVARSRPYAKIECQDRMSGSSPTNRMHTERSSNCFFLPEKVPPLTMGSPTAHHCGWRPEREPQSPAALPPYPTATSRLSYSRAPSVPLSRESPQPLTRPAPMERSGKWPFPEKTRPTRPRGGR